MRFSLLPRENSFFILLKESSANLKITAAKLLDLMEKYEDVPAKVEEIRRLEEVGDSIIHRIMTQLHKTFITPLDREDIAQVGERLDDVLDCIEEAARYMTEYHIVTPTESARELSRIIVRCAETLDKAMDLLGSRGAKLKGLLDLKDQLNTLENEADRVTSRAMGELFESYSAIDIIKWKEVYGQLEGATDRCEEIAAILEGIVIKHA
jgi:predicted phosphate transport protein (TIGR00153 family)